jgi:hypothetical protein
MRIILMGKATLGVALLILAMLAGCGSIDRNDASLNATLTWKQAEKRILYVEPSFNLHTYRFIGTTTMPTEPRDDWNQAARAAAARQLREVLLARGIRLVVPPDVITRGDLEMRLDDSQEEAEDFETVEERTVRRSCGRCRELRQTFSADYALYVAVQNTHNTGLSAAVRLPLLALTGLGYYNPLGGPRSSVPLQYHGVANASTAYLYSLETGEVVWSQTMEAGDWRYDASARRAVEALLRNSPL